MTAMALAQVEQQPELPFLINDVAVKIMGHGGGSCVRAHGRWKTQSVAVDGDTVAVGTHLASYERGEDYIWRNVHRAPGAVILFDLSSVAQGAMAADSPTAFSTSAGSVSGYTDVIAPLDKESSAGVHRAYWVLLGVAGLVLLVAALAFYARRTRGTTVADDNL